MIDVEQKHQIAHVGKRGEQVYRRHIVGAVVAHVAAKTTNDNAIEKWVNGHAVTVEVNVFSTVPKNLRLKLRIAQTEQSTTSVDTDYGIASGAEQGDAAIGDSKHGYQGWRWANLQVVDFDQTVCLCHHKHCACAIVADATHGRHV